MGFTQRLSIATLGLRGDLVEKVFVDGQLVVLEADLIEIGLVVAPPISIAVVVGDEHVVVVSSDPTVDLSVDAAQDIELEVCECQ